MDPYVQLYLGFAFFGLLCLPVIVAAIVGAVNKQFDRTKATAAFLMGAGIVIARRWDRLFISEEVWFLALFFGLLMGFVGGFALPGYQILKAWWRVKRQGRG